MKDFILFILIAIVVVVLIFGEAYLSNCDDRVITHCEVTDKTVKQHDDDAKYLIFTKVNNEEVQVFEITDSLVQGRWNSSDVYAAIEVGKTYSFEVVGKRIPFFSMYPNIIGYEEERAE